MVIVACLAAAALGLLIWGLLCLAFYFPWALVALVAFVGVGAGWVTITTIRRDDE